MRTRILISVAAMTGLITTSSQAGNLTEADLSLFQPPLQSVWEQPKSEVDEARIKLGQMLYHEKRISQNNDISCNSCHDVKQFGVDGRAFSLGFEGHEVGRNSPTVFNAFGHISQFWDGRATTVEHQAKGPILAAGEMGMPSGDAVVERLKAIPGYQPLFTAAFPEDSDPINYDNVGIAIGAFERQMATPARWDLFLQGYDHALTDREKRGLDLFAKNGCTTCHNGTLMGGRLYQKIGLVKPWPNKKDKGRSEITGKASDEFYFKVPSLRNIEKTGPYFHDASSQSLESAIAKMGEHQLGLKLKDEDVADIAAFLTCMTADIPEPLKETPALPGLQAKTEKPAASFE